jgi:hypothetical protein
VAIVMVAFVLESIWTITDLIGRRTQWLLPGYQSLVQKHDQ